MGTYDHVSDDELLKIAGSKPSPSSDLGHIHDDELLKIAGVKKSEGPSMFAVDPNMQESLVHYRDSGRAPSAPGELVDSVLGVPVRVGASEYSKGKGFLDSAKAALNSVGTDPKNAPDSADTISNFGVKNPIIGATLATGLDLAQVPVGLMAKGGAKALAMAGEAADGSKLSEGASNAANKVMGFFRKTASEFTGVPDKEIEAYAQRADKINQLIKDHSVEGKFDKQLAANHMRENVLNDVKRTRQELNGQLSEALKNADPAKNIDVSPIIKTLEEQKGRINPHLNPEGIKDVDNLIGRVKAATQNGLASVQDLQGIKKFLGDHASPSFGGSGLGFQVGSEGANASKAGFGAAKTLMDEVGPVEVKNANRQLAQLHDIEESMTSTLLDPHMASNSLYSVGTGANARDTLALRRLGDMTGKNYVNDATDLAAAHTFSNPPLTTKITTGKANLIPNAMGTIGGAIGGLVGNQHGQLLGGSGVGYMVGKNIGSALTSPLMLKKAIDSGRISAGAIDWVAQHMKINPDNVVELYNALNTTQGESLLAKAISMENMPTKVASEQEKPKVVMSTTIRRMNDLKK